MTASFDWIRFGKMTATTEIKPGAGDLRLLLALVAVLGWTLVGSPAPASAATGWTSVTSGDRHTCGIRGGRVYCWGSNAQGQLGDGTNEGRAIAKPIKSGASDWTSVSAGAYHTCAVRAGRVACWGQDSAGELGDGVAGGVRAYPAFIKSGSTDWKAVSAGGAHTCAVRTGRVACWGNDGVGALGDGLAGGVRAYPAFIKSGSTDWKAVSAGASHTCAVRSGRIACWGYDDAGQLGDGGQGGLRAYPVLIKSGASDWRSVSAGGEHTCGVRAGRVACWGWDGSGELGDGAADAVRAYPAYIKSGATDWGSVSAGNQHTCAVRAGRVACWGRDNTGQLGDGTAGGFRAYPQVIASNAADWTALDAGEYHTCAIRVTRIACWGEDFFGQLGDGSASGDTPDPVPNFEVS